MTNIITYNLAAIKLISSIMYIVGNILDISKQKWFSIILWISNVILCF